MSQEVTLTIPEHLYRRAEEIARAQNRDVAAVLADAIILDAVSTDGSSAAIDREEAAFLSMHETLRSRFLGDYVAIHGGELVDHDTDQVTLFRRVKARFPGEFVWIAPVRQEPLEEYVIQSPRLNGTAL